MRIRARSTCSAIAAKSQLVVVHSSKFYLAAAGAAASKHRVWLSIRRFLIPFGRLDTCQYVDYWRTEWIHEVEQISGDGGVGRYSGRKGVFVGGASS